MDTSMNDTPPPARAGTPTETPRTDAVRLKWAHYKEAFRHDKMADHAKQLERELSALTSANAAMAGECRELRGQLACSQWMLEKVNGKFGQQFKPYDHTRLIQIMRANAKLLALPPTGGAHAGEEP